ncbi:MAG: ABC transporter ATP-binding protein [Bacillus sp. (in: firmicutes)]
MSIVVKNLTKKFGSRMAVDDVSFSLEQGGCTALIGPNGAGKSTLLKMLSGLLQPTNGTISIQKEKGWKRNIGYLPQTPEFYTWMTAVEFLETMAILSKVEKPKERVDEVLAATGIQYAADRKIGGFSGGMKQRLGLAQALLHRPKYLLLDEPVSALDPLGRREVMKILSDLKAHSTIVYSTHVLHDAEEISDNVLLIKDGALMAHDQLSALLGTAGQTFTIKASCPLPAGLKECSFVKKVEYRSKCSADVTLWASCDKHNLLSWCLSHRVDLLLFQEKRQTLEQIFMEVIK